MDSGGPAGSRGQGASAAPDEPLARERWTLDRIPSGCLVVDEGWTITHVNPHAEAFLRRRRDALVGTRLWDMCPDIAGEPFHDACRRAMSERVDIVVEGYYPRQESWLALHARPWRQGLALFLRDVAREHRIAQRVVESEAQLRDFLESATDFVHMLAADGRILYANRAWREALGYTERELAQLTLFDVVAPESHGVARRALRRILRGDVPVESQLVVRAKDGRRFVVRGSANRRVTKGVGVSTRGIYRVVTAELEAAELRRQAQRTEASTMRAKSAFLHRVSHELRTPLSAVIGFADILRLNRGGRLTPAEVDFADRIARQGRHLLTLVDDVLAYADIEARRMAIEPSTVNLSVLLHGVVEAQRQQVRFSGIPVLVDAPPHVMLTTDEDVLRRILRYVLDDAIKRGAGSSVTARLVTEAGTARAIEVRDEYLEQRSAAHAGTEDPSVALDLGLTVAHSLCQLLGHQLLVETDDRGMTVRRIEFGEPPRRGGGEPVDVATTLHAFLDASPLPIIAFSPDWTVRVWNSAAARLFGWSSAEIVGSRLPLVREDDEPAYRALLRRALQAPDEVIDVPAKHARSDGGTIDVHVSIAPLRLPDGRLQGFISIVADVTERNRLEDELRQAQKMEVVGRLAAGVAHDFNNLLTVIAASSQFLLDDVTEEQVRHDVVAIQDATARAADLTRQLLLLARKAVPRPRVIDLNQQLANVVRMLRRTLGNAITLVAALSDEPAFVVADPAQLELAAMNLALNARDAMPNGGTLTLATSRVPGEGADPGHVLLEVRDTGVGMDAGIRDRAFEPFFTTKEEGKGTGLGLATVRAIVTDANGSIAIDTEPGRGTTVRVQLPLADAAP
ncbi:MAG TPA: PAS domain-containing protein [Gemmatimonadaceae bacterium]|nr:PAS domain-containing protein [Gemmatimonadaceae bacterium]